jgi:hypothetical protein
VRTRLMVYVCHQPSHLARTFMILTVPRRGILDWREYKTVSSQFCDAGGNLAHLV